MEYLRFLPLWILIPMNNLHSTVWNVWEIVDQIIHFSGGNKRTVRGVISSTIQQGEFTKFMTTKWVMWMINTNNVDCIEVINPEDCDCEEMEWDEKKVRTILLADMLNEIFKKKQKNS